MALQQKTVEALAELVTEEIPEQLVLEELRERIHDLNHRLEGQGMSLGQFLGVTGRSEEEFLEELRAGALQSVKADLALRALVEAEEIEITDEELDEELAAMGSRLEMDADQVRSQLEQAGRLSAVRSDRRKAKAMRWLDGFRRVGRRERGARVAGRPEGEPGRGGLGVSFTEASRSIDAQGYSVPWVVESTSRGERNYDLFSRLLQGAHHLPRAPRSTTRWPTWSAPSCCSSSRRSRTRTSTSTSTRPAGTSPRCSPSTTR